MKDFLLNGYEVVMEDDFNRLVNKKVGEVLEQERQRREKQRRNYEKNKEIIENTNEARNDQRRFFKVYENKGESMRELSLADAGILFKLTTSLYYGGEGLLTSGKMKEGGFKPLTKRELTKLLGKSKNGIDAAINSLQAIGALKVEKKGRSNAYYISEDLVSCGKGTGSGSFTKVYKTKAQELLSKMTDSEAGFIFKCLPFIHYSTHALVLNPHEEYLKKVNSIRGCELADVLGIDAGTLNNISTSLKRKQLMMFINIGTKGKGYVVNPYLADRGYRSEFTESTRAYFEVFEE